MCSEMGREGLGTGASHAPLTLILSDHMSPISRDLCEELGKGETTHATIGGDSHIAVLDAYLGLGCRRGCHVGIAARTAKEGCTYYSETQHNLCAGFRAYWEKYGGLAVFGYPITKSTSTMA